jgi:uncharacterized membrane protein YeiB
MSFSSVHLTLFLSGAIFLGYVVISLVFARFWRKTGERLFVLFSIAFFLLGVERIILVCNRLDNNVIPTVYLTRVVAFALIVAAVVDKNRRSRMSR